MQTKSKTLLIFTTIFILAAHHAVLAQQAEFDFSRWPGTVNLEGEHLGDLLGSTVVAGDFDGDGWQDLVIGAPQSDEPGKASCGKVYVIYGKAGYEGSYVLDDPFVDHLTLSGDTGNDELGNVIDVWDVEGNGSDDLLLGAPKADVSGKVDAGKIYLLYGGSRTTGEFNIGEFPGMLRVDGNEAADQFGASVAAGDFTGDLETDLIVGAPLAEPAGEASTTGIAYLLKGPLGSGVKTLDALASMVVYGEQTDDRLGSQVLGLNLNDTGPDDMVFAAPNADLPDEQRERGILYVMFGSGSLPAEVELAQGDSADVTMAGNAGSSRFGTALDGGDIDGNGYDEIVAGAPGGGSVLVIEGRSSFDPFIDLTYSSPALSISGSDSLGSVLQVNDYTGDGLADIFLGTPATAPSGKAYLVNGGPLTGASGSVPDLGRCIFSGDRTGDRLGQAVCLGDFVKDGKPDMIIGAPQAEGEEGTDAGLVYIVKGGTPYLTDLYPGYGESGIPADFDMEFWIRDDLTASEEDINLNTLEVYLSGYTFTAADFDTTGSVGAEAIHVLLDIVPGTFLPNTAVDAEITGFDKAGNEIPTTQYVFHMLNDFTGPWLENIAPPDSSKYQPVQPEIAFSILDAASGVDLDEVWMHVAYDTTAGMPVTDTFFPKTDTLIVVDTISVSPLGYRISYIPPEPFMMGDQIHVEVEGKDFAGFPLQDPRKWLFTTVDNDTLPPILQNEFPANGASGVEVQAVNVDGFLVEIYDEQTGVNPASIDVTRTYEAISGDTTVSITDLIEIGRIDANLYTVSYRPTGQEGDPQFQYGETARFNVRAFDLAFEPNLMDTTYSFILETDINPPEITGRQPNPDLVDLISVFSEIKFDITDDKSGVDDSTIVFKVNNEEIDIEDLISPNEYLGYTIRYPNIPDSLEQVPLPEDTVTVSAWAADNVGNEMVLPEEWSFIAVPDSRTPRMTFSMEMLLVEQSDTIEVWETIPPSDYLLNKIPQDSIRISFTVTDTIDEWESGIDLSTMLIMMELENTGPPPIILLSEGEETHTGYKTGTMDIDETESPGLYNVSFEPDRLSIAEEVTLSVSVRDKGGIQVVEQLRFNISYGGRLNKPFPPIITPAHGSDPNNRTTILFLGEGSGTFTLYNLEGYAVYSEENIPPLSGSLYKVTWGGEYGAPGSSQRIVPAGLYVYQFKSSSKVYNGTIAVAR